jgi:voltage-gated potassium channel
LIIIFGGIGVYLAEHHHEGANITKLGDALWWAVVTVATVGYGDYYPVTTVGRQGWRGRLKPEY